MKRFFRYLLAVITGGLITAFIIIVFFMILMTTLTIKSKKPFETKPNSVYVIKLDKEIVERSQQTIFDELEILPGSKPATIGLNEILKNIEKAKYDNNIKGIFLNLSVIRTGIATVSDIRNALKDFKSSGKFIIAYSDLMEKKAYYLATIADKVYLNPVGVIEFTGLKSEVNFFKGTFDKLGIEPKVFRVGKFKSFGEMYDNTKLSEENRLQINAYISGVWNLMLDEISVSRNIPVNDLNRYASTLITETPEKTYSAGLIDSLLYYDQVLEILKEQCNLNSTDDIKLVSYNQLRKANKKSDGRGFAKNKIAVIYAWGDVIMGSSDEGNIGADRISGALKKARNDNSIKAVVLRVNSGGGSALASEVIWRELELTKQKKPVVASFGDIAASGGYYISVPADTIIASPYSLTGSIGVVGILFNAEKFFNDWLGVTHEVVKTNPHADMGSVFRSVTPVEETSVNKMLDVIYKSFVNHVAEGRNSTFTDIHKIAQGRIWLATDAYKINLIDTFGGLNEAVKIAASMANIDHYRIKELPEMKDPLKKWLDEASEEVFQRSMKQKMGITYDYISEIEKIINSGTYQALLPMEIQIK